MNLKHLFWSPFREDLFDWSLSSAISTKEEPLKPVYERFQESAEYKALLLRLQRVELKAFAEPDATHSLIFESGILLGMSKLQKKVDRLRTLLFAAFTITSILLFFII